MRLWSSSLLCVGLLLGRNAQAAEQDDRVATLEFEASGPGCPTERAFREEVRERTPARQDRSRTLAVRLRPSENGFAGTVEALERTGSTMRSVASRTVEGATCEEVASAALLLVALGSVESPQEPAPTTPVPAERPAEAPTEPSSRRVRFHIGGVGTMAGGLGPLAVGGGARLGIGFEGASVFRPELRVGLDAFADGRLGTALGTAQRSLITSRIDACPLGIGSDAISVAVCVAGALGEIRVRGERVSQPRDESRLYSALGGLVRGRARIVGKLSAELAAGAMTSLERHRFFFVPDTTVLLLDQAIPFTEGGLTWSIP